MGCAPSTIGEESVSRCRERRLLMKKVVIARTAFAAAHAAYAAAVMSTGLALGRYAHYDAAVEVPSLKRDVSMGDSLLNQKSDAVLEGSGRNKLKRSASMIEAAETKQKRGVSKKDSDSSVSNDCGLDESATVPVPGWDYFSVNLREPVITSSDEDEDEQLEFLTPDNLSKIEVSDDDDEEEAPLLKKSRFQTTVSDEIKKASNANWLKEISDQFIKASECAQEVSRLLGPRYRYQHNAEDAREFSSAATVDHAVRVMRLITWNQPNDVVSNVDDFHDLEQEPLADVLDKLLIWEKKLYDAVKTGELRRREYQRKLLLLAKQKRRGASIELLVKTKASVRHLHTRYIVDMQLIDSTVSEINNLRDFQLYPKLVELVEGMANMWKNMSTHHSNQLRIATDLELYEISATDGETTWDQYEQTIKLLRVFKSWKIQFNNLIVHQRRYIRALNLWLKLNLIPVRNNIKEKLSSSSKRASNPPIQLLIMTWHEYTDKLPYETVNTTMTSFAATMELVKILRKEVMEMKEKCEETRKEYLRKCQVLEDWLRMNNERGSSDRGSERRAAIDGLKMRLDEEMDGYRKLCLGVRAKSTWSLGTRLLEIFRAMSDYGHTCVDAYNRILSSVLSEEATHVKSDPS